MTIRISETDLQIDKLVGSRENESQNAKNLKAFMEETDLSGSEEATNEAKQ